MATADGSQPMEDRSTHQEDEVLSGSGGLEAASCRPCPMVRGSGPQGSSAWTCRVLGSIQCLGPTTSREGHLFCGCPLFPTGLPMGGSACSLSTHQAWRPWPHVPCCWALHSPPEPAAPALFWAWWGHLDPLHCCISRFSPALLPVGTPISLPQPPQQASSAEEWEARGPGTRPISHPFPKHLLPPPLLMFPVTTSLLSPSLSFPSPSSPSSFCSLLSSPCPLSAFLISPLFSSAQGHSLNLERTGETALSQIHQIVLGLRVGNFSARNSVFSWFDSGL